MSAASGHILKKKQQLGDLAVRWLGLRTSIAGGMGSIPGRRTKIPRAAQRGPRPPPKKRSSLECEPFVNWGQPALNSCILAHRQTLGMSSETTTGLKKRKTLLALLIPLFLFQG